MISIIDDRKGETASRDNCICNKSRNSALLGSLNMHDLIKILFVFRFNAFICIEKIIIHSSRVASIESFLLSLNIINYYLLGYFSHLVPF